MKQAQAFKRMSISIGLCGCMILLHATTFAQSWFDQSRAALWQAQGAAAMQKGDYKKALKKLTDSYQLEPESETLAAAIQATIQLKMFDRAETLLAILLKEEPNYPMGDFYLGFLKLRKKDGEAAIRHLQRSAEREEYSAYSFSGLFLAFRGEGDGVAAEESLMQARLLDPELQEQLDLLAKADSQVAPIPRAKASRGTIVSASAEGAPLRSTLEVAQSFGSYRPRTGEKGPIFWPEREVLLPQIGAGAQILLAGELKEIHLEGSYEASYLASENRAWREQNALSQEGALKAKWEGRHGDALFTLRAREVMAGATPGHLLFHLAAEPKVILKSGENELYLGVEAGAQALDLTRLSEPILFLPRERGILFFRGTEFTWARDSDGNRKAIGLLYQAATRPSSALSQHQAALTAQLKNRIPLPSIPLDLSLQLKGGIFSFGVEKEFVPFAMANAGITYDLARQWEISLLGNMEWLLSKAAYPSTRWLTSLGVSYRFGS